MFILETTYISDVFFESAELLT